MDDEPSTTPGPGISDLIKEKKNESLEVLDLAVSPSPLSENPSFPLRAAAATMDKSMLGDLDNLPDEDKMRMSAMIEQLQMRDRYTQHAPLIIRPLDPGLVRHLISIALGRSLFLAPPEKQ